MHFIACVSVCVQIKRAVVGTGAALYCMCICLCADQEGCSGNRGCTLLHVYLSVCRSRGL